MGGTERDGTERDGVDRRDLLCGGCALALSACAGPTSGTGPTGGDATGADTGGDDPTFVGDPDDPLSYPDYPCNQPIDPGGDGWTAHTLAQNPELADVGGWITSVANGKLYILAHVMEGCYVAADRACTHQGVLMDYVPARGQFVCPRHASLFDWTGAVVGGPAPTPIRVYFAGRDGDTVWVKITADR